MRKNTDRLQFGPDRDNILEKRPYFVVPLDNPDEIKSVVSRIADWLKDESEKSKGPITDVYILSHGWHRSFYGAIAAYDRLMSRVAILLHRGRLGMPQPYHPHFIMLHWHSDPGENNWVDPEGRRHKPSFMRLANEIFEPNVQCSRTEYANALEDIYQLFARVSAPDAPSISNEILMETARKLLSALDVMRLKEALNAENYDKATALWSCYNSCDSKHVLLDQDVEPARQLGLLGFLKILIGFLIGALGATTLLSLLYSLVSGNGSALMTLFKDVQSAFVQHTAVGEWLHAVCDTLWKQALAIISSVLIISIAGLGLLTLRRAVQRRDAPSGSLQALLAFVFWLPLQLACLVPLLLGVLASMVWGCAVGYVVKIINAPLPLLFNERLNLIREKNKNPEPHTRKPGRKRTLRMLLADAARLPAHWVKQTVSIESFVYSIAGMLDAQAAFWEMQLKAVYTGRRAAYFLRDALQGYADNQKDAAPIRLHFIGHSFGGLVVSNAVRSLIGETLINPKSAEMHSVILLQPALATDWLANEAAIADAVSGSFSCIYSRYDTANSFYYPVANSLRMSAGFVGLMPLNNGKKPIKLPSDKHKGYFSSLVNPPNMPFLLGDASKTANQIFNIDASRMIYDGPAATGGGHNDIFKSDVVYLLWGLSHYSIPSMQMKATVSILTKTDSMAPLRCKEETHE